MVTLPGNMNGWDSAAKGCRGTAIAIVCVPLVGTFYLGFIHVVEWLRLGKWPHYSTTNLFSDWGIAYPKVSWLGVQAMIDFVMGVPAAWSLFGAAVVLGFIFQRFVED
jgi:hypothetical protein